jgi:hypothetical protein
MQVICIILLLIGYTYSIPVVGTACTNPRPDPVTCPTTVVTVCGFTASGASATFNNSCLACSHPQIKAWVLGACTAQQSTTTVTTPRVVSVPRTIVTTNPTQQTKSSVSTTRVIRAVAQIPTQTSSVITTAKQSGTITKTIIR